MNSIHWRWRLLLLLLKLSVYGCHWCCCHSSSRRRNGIATAVVAIAAAAVVRSCPAVLFRAVFLIFNVDRESLFHLLELIVNDIVFGLQQTSQSVMRPRSDLAIPFTRADSDYSCQCSVVLFVLIGAIRIWKQAYHRAPNCCCCYHRTPLWWLAICRLFFFDAGWLTRRGSTTFGVGPRKVVIHWQQQLFANQ